jgi:hypothetical protein
MTPTGNVWLWLPPGPTEPSRLGRFLTAEAARGYLAAHPYEWAELWRQRAIEDKHGWPHQNPGLPARKRR